MEKLKEMFQRGFTGSIEAVASGEVDKITINKGQITIYRCGSIVRVDIKI